MNKQKIQVEQTAMSGTSHLAFLEKQLKEAQKLLRNAEGVNEHPSLIRAVKGHISLLKAGILLHQN